MYIRVPDWVCYNILHRKLCMIVYEKGPAYERRKCRLCRLEWYEQFGVAPYRICGRIGQTQYNNILNERRIIVPIRISIGTIGEIRLFKFRIVWWHLAPSDWQYYPELRIQWSNTFDLVFSYRSHKGQRIRLD